MASFLQITLKQNMKQVLFIVISKYVSGEDKAGLEGRNYIWGCYLKVSFMAACCDWAGSLEFGAVEWIQQLTVLETDDRKQMFFMLLPVYWFIFLEIRGLLWPNSHRRH